ncbi:hypothetical protein NEOLEDRAFT_1040317, partial [Neolentinus lepideus HHB14362 ss-1]
GTWYEPGMGASCGANASNPNTVAISAHLYSNYSCATVGEFVEPEANDTGPLYGTVKDICYACGDDDIALDPKFFAQFAPLSSGPINITWWFV